MLLIEMPRRKVIPRSLKRRKRPSSQTSRLLHPPHKIWRFCELIEEQYSVAQISIVIDVSIRTCYEWQRNYRRYGSPLRPCNDPGGRPPLLSVADERALFDTLMEKGWMLLAEMKY
jgi:transposase